jgi:hypothetical protein
MIQRGVRTLWTLSEIHCVQVPSPRRNRPPALVFPRTLGRGRRSGTACIPRSSVRNAHVIIVLLHIIRIYRRFGFFERLFRGFPSCRRYDIILLSSYCYCFPSVWLKRNNNRPVRRQNYISGRALRHALVFCPCRVDITYTRSRNAVNREY